MMHFVDNLSVKGITINGVQTATFTEEQRTFCGLDIKVKSRKEFATRVQGYGVVDCPECLKKITERINRKTYCENCRSVFSYEDFKALTPFDTQVLCVMCKNK